MIYIHEVANQGPGNEASTHGTTGPWPGAGREEVAHASSLSKHAAKTPLASQANYFTG